jgi:hypothetical protein
LTATAGGFPSLPPPQATTNKIDMIIAISRATPVSFISIPIKQQESLFADSGFEKVLQDLTLWDFSICNRWGHATVQLPNCGLSLEHASITTLEVELHHEIPVFGGVLSGLPSTAKNSIFERGTNP